MARGLLNVRRNRPVLAVCGTSPRGRGTCTFVARQLRCINSFGGHGGRGASHHGQAASIRRGLAVLGLQHPARAIVPRHPQPVVHKGLAGATTFGNRTLLHM